MRNLFKYLVVGVIVLGFGVGAAFGAGTAYGRGGAPKAASAAGGASQSRISGGSSIDNPADGMQHGGGDISAGMGGRPAAMGTVDAVSGSTITVKTQSGTTTVKIDDKTVISKSVNGTIADLTPGTTIFVTGNAGSDGTVAATSISINPDSAQRQGGQAGQGAQSGQAR